jgi:hypothetical protein
MYNVYLGMSKWISPVQLMYANKNALSKRESHNHVIDAAWAEPSMKFSFSKWAESLWFIQKAAPR